MSYSPSAYAGDKDTPGLHQLIGRAFSKLARSAEVIVWTRSHDADTDRCCHAVDVLYKDGTRKAAADRSVSRTLLAVVSDPPTRHCSCQLHVGERTVSVAKFSPRDRWCSACRRALATLRRAAKRQAKAEAAAGLQRAIRRARKAG